MDRKLLICKATVGDENYETLNAGDSQEEATYRRELTCKHFPNVLLVCVVKPCY